MRGPLKEFPELNLIWNLGSVLKVLVIWVSKYLSLKPRLFQTISTGNPNVVWDILAVTKIHPGKQTQQRVCRTFLENFTFSLSISFLIAKDALLHTARFHISLCGFQDAENPKSSSQFWALESWKIKTYACSMNPFHNEVSYLNSLWIRGRGERKPRQASVGVGKAQASSFLC